MKIEHLIEAFTTTKRYGYSNNSFKPKEQNYTNGGLTGRVYSHGSEHTLTKVPHNAEYNDEYYRYIRFIVDNKLAQSNPHFPRVYKIYSIMDNNGKSKYKIEIEKLFHSKELNDEQRTALLEMYFSEDAMQYYNKYYGHYDLDTKFDIMCSDIIDNAISTGRVEYIIHEQLSKACAIIYEYVQDEKLTGSIDMHSDNFMFRIAGHVPQLVITDPIA